MLAAARRNGFVAFEIKPNLSDLLTEIAAETPWSCCRTSVGTGIPSGTNASRSATTSRPGASPCDPATSGACKCRSALRTHLATRRLWAMLLLPPRRCPASVAAGDYLSAVARLEKAGPLVSARGAYERALERWPDDLMALMGSGNTAYRPVTSQRPSRPSGGPLWSIRVGRRAQ